MSVTRTFLSEKLIEGYVKTPTTLKDQLLTMLVTQLCQDFELQKCIMVTPQLVASDRNTNRRDFFNEWEDHFEKRVIAVCEVLPLSSELKSELMFRVWFTAVELLGWNNRHHTLLSTNPAVNDWIYNLTDWTLDGRLNERKIVGHLVQDVRIPVYQRYQLACMYCLESYIDPLWKRLLPEDQENLRYKANWRDHNFSEVTVLWYRLLTEEISKMTGDEHTFCEQGLRAAIREGATAAFIYFWNGLSEDETETLIVETAMYALSQSIENHDIKIWIRDIVMDFDTYQAMPTHCSDILYFCLSQMSEMQRIDFFTEIDKRYGQGISFGCFLQFPHQDFFLPVFTKVSDIFPTYVFGNILLIIIDKYTNEVIFKERKDIVGCNYVSLLEKCLEQAPEHYKHFIYKDRNSKLFSFLIFKLTDSIRQVDTGILKNILQQATAEKQQLFFKEHGGKDICTYLIKNDNELAECILTECLPEKDVTDFKMEYIGSDLGKALFFDLMGEDNKKRLDSFLKFIFSSDTDILQFKSKIIFELQHNFFDFVVRFDFHRLNKAIWNYFPSIEDQRKYKDQCVDGGGMEIYFYFTVRSEWENLSLFLNLFLPSEEAIEKFKEKCLLKFSHKICGHFLLHEEWESAEHFFKWHRLSPEAITQLKKDAFFSSNDFCEIHKLLSDEDGMKFISLCLKWVLTEKESAKVFKSKFREFMPHGIYDSIETEQIIQRWEDLIETRMFDIAASESYTRENASKKIRRLRL